MILNLRKYQKRAIRHLIDLPGAALFMEMGLGKTACALWYIKHLMYTEFEVGKTLIIAPYNVADRVWEDERDQWDQFRMLKISKVMGSEQERLTALRVKADIYIINVENTQWLVTLYLTAWPFDCIIVDESSTFKSPDSKRWLTLSMVMPNVDRRVILTGTPAPNGLHDIWAQMFLIDGGKRLKMSITQFRNEFLFPEKVGAHGVTKWGTTDDNSKRIYELMGDVCLTMREKDYLELPPLEFIEHRIKLPDKVMQKYGEFEKTLVLDWLEKEGDEITANNAATLTGKLLQFAGGAVYTNDTEKKEYLTVHDYKLKLVEELIASTNGEPILIAYQFKHEMWRMKKKFGGHTFRPRTDDTEKWNNKEYPIMYLHPKSGGHGLNLQFGGNTVLWFGPTWNLEYWLQFNKRVHRSGQTKPVFVHTGIAMNTMDVRCARVTKQKEEAQDGLLNATKYNAKAEVISATKELFKKYKKRA